MTRPDILIQRGVPAPLRAAAGELFFEAFADKFGSILGRDQRGPRLMARLMNPGEALVALSADGTTLLGLAGLKSPGRAFMSGSLSDMAVGYGWFGGLWRGLLLLLLDHRGEPGCLHIDALAVTETARGTGVGTMLLDACRDEARQRGLTGLSLDVIDTKSRAHALYARYGFADIRRYDLGPFRRVFGFDHAIRMRCDLAPA